MTKSPFTTLGMFGWMGTPSSVAPLQLLSMPSAQTSNASRPGTHAGDEQTSTTRWQAPTPHSSESIVPLQSLSKVSQTSGAPGQTEAL